MSSAPEPRRTASWAGCQPKSSRPLKRGMKTAGHRWDAWALRQMSETPSRCCVWRKQVLLPARRSTSMVGHPLWIRYSRSKFSGGERHSTDRGCFVDEGAEYGTCQKLARECVDEIGLRN